MKILYLLITSSFALEGFIRNLDKPPCIHCKHYLPDPSGMFVSSNAKCKMFGGKDTHTGIILYQEAVSVRDDVGRCSVAGTYFEAERNLFLKRAEHLTRRVAPLFILLCFLNGFI
jgi:hypothetical protein